MKLIVEFGFKIRQSNGRSLALNVLLDVAVVQEGQVDEGGLQVVGRERGGAVQVGEGPLEQVEDVLWDWRLESLLLVVGVPYAWGISTAGVPPHHWRPRQALPPLNSLARLRYPRRTSHHP